MQNKELDFKLPEYQKTSLAVLLAFCGYVIVWYLQMGYRWPFLGEIRFEFLYAASLSVFAIFYTRIDSLRCPLTLYLFMYLALVFLYVPLSIDFDHSWQIFVDRVIKFAFMAWFIIAFVKSPRALVFFIGAFMLAYLKMGQEGFVGQISGNLVWQNQGIMRLHGATPLYRHPNSFSGMAVSMLPFIFAFFSIANRKIKAVLLLQALFALNIILFTGSRTGYVAMVLFVMLAIYKIKTKKIKKYIVVFFIGLIVFQLVPDDYKGRFESIFSGKEKEGRSASTRIQIIKDAWAIFLDNPLGVGVGAFPLIRSKVFGRKQDTHNLYLEIATNIGIQGLIVFGLLIYKMLKMLNSIKDAASERKKIIEKKLLNNNDKDLKKYFMDLKIVEASALAVYLFIMVRLTLGLFGMDLYEIYWWFASGLTIALYNLSKKMKLDLVK
ncbi:MAG: O-antigen ligase family protein [Desulfobacteraceae bacterium]|nr:O-antigen ligase family protein [Desulfobacteraceae bacterium]